MSSLGDNDGESRPISEESIRSRLAIRSRTQSTSQSQSTSSPGFPKSLASSSNDSKPRVPRFRAVKSATDSYNKVSDTRERSASSDFRSVIDDLTIKNQKLKKKLQKLQSKKDSEKSLFELKIHDLTPEKSAELFALLRGFVETIPENGQEQQPALGQPSSERGDNNGGDSAYASLTPGDSSTDASSQLGKVHKPKISVVQKKQTDTLSAGKLPLPPMSKDLIKMKMVVQRLEEVFKGRRGRSHAGGSRPTAKEEAADSKKASENVEYLHHLTSNRSSKKGNKSDSDESEWIYLNLLNNEAKLHEINVTPMFIRRAVSTMSRCLELSSDGQRVRWRGGEELSAELDEADAAVVILPEEKSPDSWKSPEEEAPPKPKRKTTSTTFAPARYAASREDDLPPSLRYDPVFLTKETSSSSSNIDSLGTSSLSSSEGEDGMPAGPISFFKGKFFLDLTSTDPTSAIASGHNALVRAEDAEEKEAETPRSPRSPRTNWRRLSPTSVYFGHVEQNEQDDELLKSFVVPPDYSVPDAMLRYDDDCFDSTGLTRLEDHFTVTLQVRTLPASEMARKRKSTSAVMDRVQPHISAVLRQIEEDREEQRSSSESERDFQPKVLDVTFAKLAPTKPPPTFYHHNSTSSDDFSVSS